MIVFAFYEMQKNCEQISLAEDWSIGLTAVILQVVNWYILEHRERFFRYIKLKKEKLIMNGSIRKNGTRL